MLPSSRRASFTSPRRRSALPCARSLSSVPKLRVRSKRPSMGLLVAAERAAKQVSEPRGDQKRAPGVLLDLTLDPFLETVEVRVAEPVRRALHPAGDPVRDLRD